MYPSAIPLIEQVFQFDSTTPDGNDLYKKRSNQSKEAGSNNAGGGVRILHLMEIFPGYFPIFYIIDDFILTYTLRLLAKQLTSSILLYEPVFTIVKNCNSDGVTDLYRIVYFLLVSTIWFSLVIRI